MALPDTFSSRQTTGRPMFLPPSDLPVIARVSRTPTCTVQEEGKRREEKGGIGAPRVQSTQLLEPVHTGILGRGWSVCSVLLHRVVLTNGPLLRADASDLSTKKIFVDWWSDRPSTSASGYSPFANFARPLGSLEDVKYESSTAQTFDCFFRRSVGRRQLANKSTRQCIRSSTCTWPQEPWVNVVSPSSTSQHLCASDRDACKRAGPHPKKTESATIALLSAREMVIRSVPSPPTPPSKISTWSSAAPSSTFTKRSSVPVGCTSAWRLVGEQCGHEERCLPRAELHRTQAVF